MLQPVPLTLNDKKWAAVPEGYLVQPPLRPGGFARRILNRVIWAPERR